MPKRTSGNLALAGYNDLFGTADAPANGEYIVNIPLAELFPPEYHPFQVRDDPAMDRLVKSVAQYGIREPGLARPRVDGGYELLVGNRRKRACDLAGLPDLPVIIREMDDDDAVLVMVDSNIEQRETLLPSEKAWAYRLKLEALNHRGAKSDTPGQLSVDIICEQTGESKSQIFRLIRLTELVPALADKVDARKLAFNPSVELSYLTRTDQALVVDELERCVMKPSLSQAQQIKKAGQDGKLTPHVIQSILSENVLKKPLSEAHPAVKRFRGYFPKEYTPEQMERVILKLLSEWSVCNSGKK